MYYLDSPSPKTATTINCGDGGPDTLLGGSGLADYIVGGSFDDTIEGNEGMDLAFGDHAGIDFFEESHKLKFATTMETGCTRGKDSIKLGSGDDIVS